MYSITRGQGCPDNPQDWARVVARILLPVAFEHGWHWAALLARPRRKMAGNGAREAEREMFLQMPSLTTRLRQGPLDPAEKHILREFHSGQSRKGPPHVSGILVAVGR